MAHFIIQVASRSEFLQPYIKIQPLRFFPIVCKYVVTLMFSTRALVSLHRKGSKFFTFMFIGHYRYYNSQYKVSNKREAS